MSGEITLEQIELTFKRRQSISKEISLFSFHVNPENFSFKAGQYMNLGMPHEGKIVFRSFSIASVKGTPGTIDFVIPFRKEGLFSQYIHSLNPGEIIQAKGPFGSMVLDEVNSETIFFFSTGTGIIPFRSMLMEIKKKLQNKKTVYFYTQQQDVEFITFLNEFILLAKEFSNFFFKVFCELCDNTIDKEYCTNTQLLNYISQITFTQTDTVFASGNPDFIKSLKGDTIYLNEKPQRIITD